MSTTVETWHSRDLPLLQALVNLSETDPQRELTARAAARTIGMEDADAARALIRLRQGGLVSEHPTAPRRPALGATGAPLVLGREGLELAGAWPSPETAADRLLAALEHLADHAPDEDTRNRARSVWQQVGEFSRDTLAAVSATMITGQVPGAGG